VTGGARAIGGASALRIAEEGRAIVIADVEEASHVIKQIEALGQRALYFKTDVSDESAVQRMVAQTVEAFGRLDILVCCAGILGKEVPLLEQTATMFDSGRVPDLGAQHLYNRIGVERQKRYGVS
jgi:NAD(P)-dependent dehydrogenase (short-subunit alcohol dehydrogenase family)